MPVCKYLLSNCTQLSHPVLTWQTAIPDSNQEKKNAGSPQSRKKKNESPVSPPPADRRRDAASHPGSPRPRPAQPVSSKPKAYSDFAMLTVRFLLVPSRRRRSLHPQSAGDEALLPASGQGRLPIQEAAGGRCRTRGRSRLTRRRHWRGWRGETRRGAAQVPDVERQQPAPPDEERLARFLAARRSSRPRRHLRPGERSGSSPTPRGFNLQRHPLLGTTCRRAGGAPMHNAGAEAPPRGVPCVIAGISSSRLWAYGFCAPFS